MLTDDQIKQLADEYLHSVLDVDEQCRSLGLLPLTEEQVDRRLQELTQLLAEAQKTLTLFEGHIAKHDLHQLFFNQYCPDLSTEDPKYAALVRELIKKDIEIYRVELERTKGNYANGYDNRVQVAALLPLIDTPPQEKQSPLLSNAIGKFLDDLRLRESASSNTITDYCNICGQFQRIIGDKPIDTISRDDIRHYLATLKKLPKHIRTKPQYRDKSIEDILAMGVTEALSNKTVQRYATCVQGFFSWAAREELIKRNPADGLTPRKDKTHKASEERNAFNRNDLIRLVAGLVKVGERGDFQGHPERFWIPLIGLYSGMRLNEICQLHIDDVVQDKESEIWYFRIEAEQGEEKSVKTAAGRRPVPVHPDLIELGFIDYFQEMQKRKAPRIWMNLSKTTRGYHKKFSCWFLGLKSAGRVIYKSFLREYVTTDDKKVFHSFRHTFDNELKQKLVKTTIIDELMGHAHKALSEGRYAEGYELQTLLDAMLKIDYCIDLTSLKKIADKLL